MISLLLWSPETRPRRTRRSDAAARHLSRTSGLRQCRIAGRGKQIEAADPQADISDRPILATPPIRFRDRMLTCQASCAQVRPDLPVVPGDVFGAQIGVTILPVRGVARLNEQAQPAVAAAAHGRDADNVNSGIAEQFVHAVLVDQYASAARPDAAPQQPETASH